MKINDLLIFNTYDSSFWYSIIYNGKIYDREKIESEKAPKKVIKLVEIHKMKDDIDKELLAYIKLNFKKQTTLIYSNNGTTQVYFLNFQFDD